MGSARAVLGIGDEPGKHCSGCADGRALGGGIYKDSKVGLKSFVFWPIWRCNASTVLQFSLDASHVFRSDAIKKKT